MDKLGTYIKELNPSQKNESANLVPALRFKDFTGSFTLRYLKDFTRINQGLQIPISERYTDNKKGRFFYITNEFLKEGSQKKYYIKDPNESVICYEEDLLMTRTGNTGQVVTGVHGAFHNNFFKIKYDNSCEKWFLYYYLTSHRTQNKILSLAGTSTIPDLNHKDFYDLKIVMPGYAEQQKIASFLSTVDLKIKQLSKKKELLEQYKKGVMQQLFSGQLRFKDEDGNDFPVWEEKTLGEVFYLAKGQGLSKDLLKDKGSHQCILYGELYTTYSEVVKTVKSSTNSDDGTISQEGDVLIPCSTTTTGVDLANATALNYGGVKIGGDISILRTKDKISSAFFAYYLTNQKKNQLAAYAQGSTIIHLYYNHFKSMNIDYPCYAEQQKIARFLSELDKKIETINSQINPVQTYKKGLLQQMFV